ncbi:MAG: STAS domain-containing protein [Planctomycetota bacterium]
MPESPIVAVEELAELVVCHVLAESLDEEHVHQVQSEVRAAAEANPGRPCILDLARVSFVPSLSLAALIRIHSEFHARQQRLLLAALQPQVHDVFVMTRLDRVFELYDDLPAALRAVGPG